KVHVIEEQINGNCVFQPNSNYGIGWYHFDRFALRRNIQILNHFENIVPNLILCVAIHYCKTRLLLHFVGKLILGHINWHNLYRGIDTKHNDRQGYDRLELALPSLATAARWRVKFLDGLKLHWI